MNKIYKQINEDCEILLCRVINLCYICSIWEHVDSVLFGLTGGVQAPVSLYVCQKY